MMRSLVLVLLAASLTACYEPRLDDCQFSCAQSAECPSSQTCVAGMCRNPGATAACELSPDAAGADATDVDGGVDGASTDGATTDAATVDAAAIDAAASDAAIDARPIDASVDATVDAPPP